MFEASKVAMEFVRSIRRIVEIIAEHDPNLADQQRRASNATVLNTAEAGRRVGRDRCNRARMAAGECDEAVGALHLGEAWGWVTADMLVEPLALADRVLAMLWRVQHPRR